MSQEGSERASEVERALIRELKDQPLQEWVVVKLGVTRLIMVHLADDTYRWFKYYDRRLTPERMY